MDRGDGARACRHDVKLPESSFAEHKQDEHYLRHKSTAAAAA
jgi:hypothetical protein